MQRYRTLLEAIYRLYEHSGFAMAGAVAFSFVVSLFPFCIFLGALSGIFGYGIVFERVPEIISGAILGLTDSLYGVMVLILTFILIAGCFVDGSVLIIMLTPIFLPLIRDLNGDPVHFGLVFIIAATIGNFTPPVGAAMYAVCSILRCPIGDYTRESIPFLIAVGLVTLLLIFIPEAVLFVPDLIFGKDF